MNKHIKEQLKQVKLAKVPNFDDNTTHILIKKQTTIKIEEDCCYLIKLNSSITNPSTTSTLASNWNNGIIPNHSYYKIDVQKIMSHMIKVVGVAFDYENQRDLVDMWHGWLPIDEIEIINKL